MNRRKALSMIAGAPALVLSQRSFARSVNDGSSAPELPIAPGPFKGTRDSLLEWQAPEWYRDAKFGIWAHWGPQSAIEYGDWYDRNMYMQGSRQYTHFLEHYVHPT